MVYRADIDGLRAVAVLLVLIYHSKLSSFPSGFIGVDIFFVISGFLITQIINQSFEQNHFSFLEFYSRRLWRLQPVFIILLLFTTFFSCLFFLPDDLISFSRSARKASLFISNLFFNQVTSSYFSPDAYQLPLLHTWSLSIEWQYYLFFPLIIYGLHRLFKKNHITILIFSLTLLSIFCSLYWTKQHPISSYYYFLTRLFEFLIGASLAFIPHKRLPFINPLIANLLGLLALGSIFYIASLQEVLVKYPNHYALIVCVSTAILMTLNTFFSNLWYSKILSFKPLVYIGLISYSLYLWHWVIFSFLRYQNVSETREILIASWIIIFIFSYLSWRWIEKPSRKLKIKFQYTFFFLLFFPVAFTHLSSHLIQKNSGYPQRFGKELFSIYQQLKQWNSPERSLCISNNTMDLEQCKIGSRHRQAKSALLIGDSFSNHYWGFMDVLGKDANLSVLVQGTSSCLALPGIYLYDWWNFKNNIYQECYDKTQTYYQMIKKDHYDYVVISQLWNNYYSNHLINQIGDERSLNSTKERLEIALNVALFRIISSGARPVIIDNLTLMPENMHDCFFQRIKLRKPYDSKQCSFNINLAEDVVWFRQLFSKMQIKYPQLILIDPSKVQCNEGKCYGDINGIPIYRDKGHLTDYASYQFGYLFLKKFNNPFV